ncbi:ABC transporter substrate-binding protein [Labilibaculum sp. K2S]|uniref:ABC transporter substrate-binding protein n=1 Tax=Labilibaculum sp. K2S TaxID=3056386 RepID=UPI0025A484C1|nr:ABC transporter substrate-binding protein [Labilibaculum sp. K2S]MDM8158576.1 ABC transporter substrate-binding protein [Labilibaculum sp. K2S]
MRPIVTILFICFTLNLSAKTVIDMAGRTVEIPEEIEKILPYDSKTSILLYPLLNDKMVAAAMLPGKKNYQFISSQYASIPEVDVKNIEEVFSVAPQLIFAGFYDKNENKESVLKLGARLSIPVVFIDLSIDNLDQTYIFLGKLFHKEVESKKYVSFLNDLYYQIDSLKKVTPAIKATAYYTLGTTGLLTDPSGSKHTEVFDFLNIPNAAKVDIPSGGHAQVNMEQVLMWNPDYIFTASFKGNSSAFLSITKDSKWKSIHAVQKGNVYQVPGKPFAWFDHPPSINRIPGAIWLCQLFYGQSETDTRTSIIQFYKLFYNYELTPAEYLSLFN